MKFKFLSKREESIAEKSVMLPGNFGEVGFIRVLS